MFVRLVGQIERGIYLNQSVKPHQKLLILGHAPLPPEHPDQGKVSRHYGRWVFDQALALSQYSDFEVTLVTLVKGASKDVELFFGKLRVLYIRACPRFRVWTFFVWDIYRLRKLIKREAPALLHAHGIEDAYARAIYKMAIPKVLTLQALYEDHNHKNPVKWYSAPKILEWLEKKPLTGFKKVIVKSKQFEEVVMLYHPHLQCDIIPNTVSSIFLGVEDVKIQRNKVAFVGTIGERKGFHLIRQALDLIDSSQVQLELNIYGGGGDSGYVEAEISRLKASGHQLVNHGSVSAEILARELATTNVLVAPSYAETFGNQVIEAMLCRCHCIVSDETGMAENVKKYRHGTIVPQGGVRELAAAIAVQLSAEGLSEEEMKGRCLARRRVMKELGPENVARKIVSYYQQCS